MEFDLTGWDWLVLENAVLVRILQSIANKFVIYNDKFCLKKSFGLAQVFRWIIHIMVSISMLTMLPSFVELYIKPLYFPQLLGWHVLFSAAVGYLGYDLIKWIGKYIIRKTNTE